MKYAEARNGISTGDLIAVRKTRDWLSMLTRWVTHSPYTHTAIAVWVSNRLLVVEQKASGCFLTPLSQYAGVDFDVFLAPHETLLAIDEVIWATLGAPISYDYMDLLRIAANRLLNWPLPSGDDALMVCSALSATLWLQAGWRPWGPLPSIPAPGDVIAALGVPPRLTVRAND